jgi:hypothetical protein
VVARFAVLFTVGAALAACSATTRDGTPIVRDGTLTGFIRETADPGATYRARRAADEARCVEFGFKPGTEAFGNCRLQLEQVRATRESAWTPRPQGPGSQDLTSMCKDAIARSDAGAIRTFC